MFVNLYFILWVFWKHLVSQCDMEASLLMQQCYTGTMGEAPDSVSVFAPFCWFSSDGTSVALRFGHWGMGEAPDESVVSLGLHTGATFDSEVPRRRGSKYQHKKR